MPSKQMGLWGDFVKAATENMAYVALSDGKTHTVNFNEQIPRLDTGSFGDEMVIQVLEHNIAKQLTISKPLARSLKKSMGMHIREMKGNIVAIQRHGKGYSTYYETNLIAHEEDTE